MSITVKLYASLRRGRFEERMFGIGGHASVRDVLAGLSIPESEASIILINDRRGEKDEILSDGDVLAVLPFIGGG